MRQLGAAEHVVREAVGGLSPGEELQLGVTWRLPGNMSPDKATHSEQRGIKITRVLGRWMATWDLKLLLGCIQRITTS